MMQASLKQDVVINSNTLSDVMVISIDDNDLLVPREDIQTFESIHDLDIHEPVKQSIGWVRYQNTKWPVYSVSRDFDLQTDNTERKPICVLLNRVDIGLLCDEIKALPCSSVELLPLPDCMVVSGSPVDSFCSYKYQEQNRIGMLYTSESIKHYIDLSTGY